MINQLQFTNTFTQVKEIKDTGNDNNLLSSKVVTSVCMLLISFGSTNPVSTFKPINDVHISDHSDIEDNFSVNLLKSFNSGKIITNKLEVDDIIKLNNEHLEVEELAERVTQAQLDEIKAHFDTKISAVEKNILSNMKLMIKESAEDIQNNFNSSFESVKNKKTERFRFWIGSVLIPILIVVGTLVATKVFHLY